VRCHGARDEAAKPAARRGQQLLGAALLHECPLSKTRMRSHPGTVSMRCAMISCVTPAMDRSRSWMMVSDATSTWGPSRLSPPRDRPIITTICRRRALVAHQHLCPPLHRARHAQQLPLANREVGAVLRDTHVQATAPAASPPLSDLAPAERSMSIAPPIVAFTSAHAASSTSASLAAPHTADEVGCALMAAMIAASAPADAAASL